jgi:hypothetical protein
VYTKSSSDESKLQDGTDDRRPAHKIPNRPKSSRNNGNSTHIRSPTERGNGIRGGGSRPGTNRSRPPGAGGVNFEWLESKMAFGGEVVVDEAVLRRSC